ncbi:hypothetical protein RI103_36365 [Paraburkholderia sp. FT54]|uniref:hypothetical protein n=1 Tax=Paraburkholderia sp. FT54 TaxID=3074437 RepID=UPI0028778446|nr:hypothetical protein [Paraburkholderia sp. FT54]WNC94616.1 hypothetical protein RI103_36365 [Paraburkholderia sp. FT54]
MRLRLDFGLRRAIMGFNEWAVPGLGGAFFVRQLSWACMGLRLAQEMETSATPARIAEALEAMASWIVVRRGAQAETEPRVQGKRKFAGRNSLSFSDVATGGTYVTVPFRRSVTRALPGLNLCIREEARFSKLELTPAGIELAELAFASGQQSEGGARRWLKQWIQLEDKEAKNVQQVVKDALEPALASDAEKRLVLERVRADERRAVLATLLCTHTDAKLATESGRKSLLDGVHHAEHAARLATCFAFEDVRASALQAAQSIGGAIQGSAQEVRDLAARQDVAEAFDALGRECDAMRDGAAPGAPSDAVGFCQEQSHSRMLEERIASLAGRAPMLFSVIEGRIDQGVAYTGKPLVADDAYEVQETEVPQARGVPGPLLRFRRLLADAGALS